MKVENLEFMKKFRPEELCIKEFNYMIMMMKDPFVHYHAFPRYDKVINLFDMKWKDNNTLSNFASTEVLNII